MATSIQLSTPINAGISTEDGKKHSSDLTSKVSQTKGAIGGLHAPGLSLESGDKVPSPVESPSKGPGHKQHPPWMRKTDAALSEGPAESPYKNYAD